jgi:hypothetical protein
LKKRCLSFELEVHEVLVPEPLLLSAALAVSSLLAFAGLDSKPLLSPPLSAEFAVGPRKPVFDPEAVGVAVGPPVGVRVGVRVGVAVDPEPGFTFNVANLVIPPADALICENVPTPGVGVVVIVNIALVAPAGTVTLGGTCAADVSELERVTSTPPAGAGLLRVTVPCDDWPPVAVVGFRLKDASVAGGRISRFNCTVLLRLAKMATLVTCPTGCVVTVKLALLCPCGMVTLGGTEATAGLLLPNVTTAPPGPATQPLRNETVPWTVPPPPTVVALKLKLLSSRTGSFAPRWTQEASWIPPYSATTPTLPGFICSDAAVTVKVALVLPAGTVTLGGTLTRCGYTLDKVTTAPPAGAGLGRFTVSWPLLPPITVSSAGVMVTPWPVLGVAVGAGGGGGFSTLKERTADQGPKLPAPSSACTLQKKSPVVDTEKSSTTSEAGTQGSNHPFSSASMSSVKVELGLICT